MARGDIRLIITDAEGCLIPGRGQPWDLDGLAAVARYNRLARERGDLPPVTICSGRPAQFVDALGQAIGLHVPAACENGAIVFRPGDGAEALFTPEQWERMFRVRFALDEEFVRNGRARLAVGKEACVSLVPADPGTDVPRLMREVAGFLARRLGMDGAELHFTYSAGAVDITPAGIDKGLGGRALAAALNLGPDQVLVIGDSHNDLPILEWAGRSAAPANAIEEVRGRVDYVAPEPFCAGVVDILRRFTGAPDREG